MFFGSGVYFPIISAGAKRRLRVRILQGDIVAVLFVAADLEQVGDPLVTIVFLQACQQVHRQLGRYDVAGHCQQFSVSGVEGKHHYVVQCKGHLREAVELFNRHAFQASKYEEDYSELAEQIRCYAMAYH